MKPRRTPIAARPRPMEVLTLDAPLWDLDVDVAAEPEPVPVAEEDPLPTELVGYVDPRALISNVSDVA